MSPLVLTVMLGTATILVQQRRAAQRESSLRIEIIQLRSDAYAVYSIRDLFGDLGLVILNDATEVELLRVGLSEGERETSRTPTGKVLNLTYADRVARILLNVNNHRDLDADDMSEPQVGLRLWRGKDSIDLLFSSSNRESSHQDLWVFVQPDQGDSFPVNGSKKCFNDSDLGRLIDELKTLSARLPGDTEQSAHQ